MKINILDSETIDKIAAGEVVERPLNVAKELVENAMDSGADAITVEIAEGGIELIRVTDNGCGIEKSQIRTAFYRHATSKIKSVEDLLSVSSLGFRGEALSSISAVSRVEIITKEKQELTGIKYEINGGQEESLSEVGAPDGTTILVRNLFYNIPVRRKFLKSAQTEGSYISEMMEHLALSRPDISFKFMINKTVKFATSGNGNLKDVIYRIYGRDVTDHIIPIQIEENGFKLKGYIGRPELNRGTRSFEIFFVNNRFIKSSVLSKSVEEAVKHVLMQHKYPFCVLALQLSPDEVDVNVHPAKLEIRFIRQNDIYDFVYRSVNNAINQKELIQKVIIDEKEHKAEILKERSALMVNTPEPFETKRIKHSSDNYISDNIRKFSKDERSESNTVNNTLDINENITGNISKNIAEKDTENKKEYIIEHNNAVETASVDITNNYVNKSDDENDFFTITDNTVIEERNDNDKAPLTIESPLNETEINEMITDAKQLSLFDDAFLSPNSAVNHRIIGQVFDTFVLVEFNENLYIIDQHAAHEKVKYERLLKQLNEKCIQSQQIFPPIVVTLNGRNMNTYTDNEAVFSNMGFEIENMSGNELAIRAVPLELYRMSEREMFLEMLDELSQGPLKGTPEAINDRLATMACKSAVKGNTKLSDLELKELISELLTLDNPFNCPHGRPTIISMSHYDLDKKFKRIVD